MFFLIMALAEPGDEVMYPDPGFPIYESMINYVGARPVPMPLLEAKRFRFDVDQFRRDVSDRTRLIIINSPANPTGGVLERGDLGRSPRPPASGRSRSCRTRSTRRSSTRASSARSARCPA
jgi:aspartate/methionine/tyrosine aminotransferase